MASVAEIVQVSYDHEHHLAVLEAHFERPDGRCACGADRWPCVWAAAAIAGVAWCQRRVDEIHAELNWTGRRSPLARAERGPLAAV